jgi:hypothetical protein
MQPKPLQMRIIGVLKTYIEQNGRGTVLSEAHTEQIVPEHAPSTSSSRMGLFGEKNSKVNMNN